MYVSFEIWLGKSITQIIFVIFPWSGVW